LKPIRILTPALELLAEIDDYESLQFTRRWHDVGFFELRINRHKRNTDTLQKGNLVMLGNQPHKVGVIQHREITLDSNGKFSEQWVIKGTDLKGVLAKRITIPPSTTAYDNKQSNTETVMHHYVTNNVINPTDIDRIISELALATNQSRGASVSWRSRYNNLAEELRDISFVSGLGWNVALDFTAKKWQFDVAVGRDLTVNQTVNPPVIFSPDFESIKTQQFTDSDLNYKNVGYVGGQGEGTLREIATVGSASGLGRIEAFIDARDVEDATQLPARGEQKMLEYANESYLDAEIFAPIKRVEYDRETYFLSPNQTTETVTRSEKIYSTFIYEEDYDLGDIVTVQNRSWGVTLNTRITEINEIYEPSGARLEAVFGTNRPTLISRLKQQFAQVDAEVRR
jgi:hypothetical protein